MPRTKVSNTTVVSSVDDIKITKETKTTKQRKKSSPSKKVVEKVDDVVDAEVDDVVVDAEVDTSSENTASDKMKFNVATQEALLSNFSTLYADIMSTIETCREKGSVPLEKHVRYLRSLAKKINSLGKQSVRVLKSKRKRKNGNNQNCGFMKPVAISKELASFAGWKKNELKSRVEVTQHLCDYIRENNLQNPENRREILPDEKISKLFSLTEDSTPLTYYGLQTHLSSHYPK